MSDFVRPRRLAFMACVCTAWHKGDRGARPLPAQVWLCAASHHDSKAFLTQQPHLPHTELFGDLAYPTPEIIAYLKEQQVRLITPQKKPKGKELTQDEKYYNR